MAPAAPAAVPTRPAVVSPYGRLLARPPGCFLLPARCTTGSGRRRRLGTPRRPRRTPGPTPARSPAVWRPARRVAGHPHGGPRSTPKGCSSQARRTFGCVAAGALPTRPPDRGRACISRRGFRRSRRPPLDVARPSAVHHALCSFPQARWRIVTSVLLTAPLSWSARSPDCQRTCVAVLLVRSLKAGEVAHERLEKRTQGAGASAPAPSFCIGPVPRPDGPA